MVTCNNNICFKRNHNDILMPPPLSSILVEAPIMFIYLPKSHAPTSDAAVGAAGAVSNGIHDVLAVLVTSTYSGNVTDALHSHPRCCRRYPYNLSGPAAAHGGPGVNTCDTMQPSPAASIHGAYATTISQATTLFVNGTMHRMITPRRGFLY